MPKDGSQPPKYLATVEGEIKKIKGAAVWKDGIPGVAISGPIGPVRSLTFLTEGGRLYWLGLASDSIPVQLTDGSYEESCSDFDISQGAIYASVGARSKNHPHPGGVLKYSLSSGVPVLSPSVTTHGTQVLERGGERYRRLDDRVEAGRVERRLVCAG